MRRVLAVLLMLGACVPASAAPEPRQPVGGVAPARIAVGPGEFPLYLSQDWSVPLPKVTRAVLVLHGYLRNAEDYFRTALAVRDAAGAGDTALMIAPQFLAQVDADAHHLSAETLRWRGDSWEGGETALAPAPLSSFAALDAILTRLGDRHLFPNLQLIVVAGHSGGAQVVQHYAIATQVNPGVTVRFVVANPSSYAWFDGARPLTAIAQACPGYDDWKYGMGHRPPYLAGPSPAALEQAYVARQIVYLLGTLDTNPNHAALDKSCAAEAQGATRYARGHAYVAAMRARDGGTPHHMECDVLGVGHDGYRMLISSWGLRALFGVSGCGE